MAPKAKDRAASRSQSPASKAKAKAAAAKSAPKAAAKAARPSPEEEAKRKAEEEAAKAKAEEEARLKAEAEEKAAAEAAAAAAEAAAKAEEERKQKEAAEAEIKRIQALANGEVTVRYSHYTEKFPIKDHKLTAGTIDELYCLSDVMPGCFIHLAEKEFAYMEEHVYIKEDPVGTFLGLMAGETYWCYVQQDPEQEKKDQEKMRQLYAGGVAAGLGDRGAEGETCSCGWGAPCTNPMICKDYDNRFANAMKAGGNPLLFTT